MYLKKLLGTVLALCFFVVAFSSSVYSADMRAAKKEGKVVWWGPHPSANKRRRNR